MTRGWRSTIRFRLTVLYAGAFFLAGAALIGLTYLYLGQSLDRQLAAQVSATEEHLTQYVTEPDAHTAQLSDALRAQFEQDRNDTLRSMLIWSLASLGAVGLAAGGLGWLLASRALHPLQQITATARRVADRSLHERIALGGPDDEVKDLADTFDAMLERLDRSFDGQRRFVASASHELRTPLTINRTLIEVALDNLNAPAPTRQLGATLLDVNHRHELLLDSLLVLASSDQRLTDPSPTDLADIASYVITTSENAAREAGVEIRPVIAAAPTVGDPLLLERLAQNLLDNAIRYNITERGWVSIATGSTGRHAYLTVENTGPTVPGYEVNTLFDPFRRLAPADRVAPAGPPSHGYRAGLGLSIVRSVAHAHDGDVRAVSRPDGGLTATARIPTTRPGSEYLAEDTE